MSRHTWLKIIAIIIIQALLLTQVESALAAIYQSKDTFREAALKFQKITAKSISLIFGSGRMELSSLYLAHLNLGALFSLLSGNKFSQPEFVIAKEARNLSNEIYKVLICLFDRTDYTSAILVQRLGIQDIRDVISARTTEESTGPPMASVKIECATLSRIV